MLADPIRWDSDWTKVLRKLSAKDVYDKLSIFEKRQIPALKDVSDRMHGIQKAMMVRHLPFIQLRQVYGC